MKTNLFYFIPSRKKEQKHVQCQSHICADDGTSMDFTGLSTLVFVSPFPLEKEEEVPAAPATASRPGADDADPDDAQLPLKVCSSSFERTVNSLASRNRLSSCSSSFSSPPDAVWFVAAEDPPAVAAAPAAIASSISNSSSVANSSSTWLSAGPPPPPPSLLIFPSSAPAPATGTGPPGAGTRACLSGLRLVWLPHEVRLAPASSCSSRAG
mmetsp:Transcript_13963/g.34511  ORF Transcript_13963/g.34511 Transcript_13963/m.34511 type:complete len:211 (-) Transcript_13963:2001-2633(-)